jgi:hypothetical protein
MESKAGGDKTGILRGAIFSVVNQGLRDDLLIESSACVSSGLVIIGDVAGKRIVDGVPYARLLRSPIKPISRFRKLYGCISGSVHHVATPSAELGLSWHDAPLNGSLDQTPARPKLRPFERNSVSHLRAVVLLHSNPRAWH